MIFNFLRSLYGPSTFADERDDQSISTTLSIPLRVLSKAVFIVQLSSNDTLINLSMFGNLMILPEKAILNGQLALFFGRSVKIESIVSGFTTIVGILLIASSSIDLNFLSNIPFIV